MSAADTTTKGPDLPEAPVETLRRQITVPPVVFLLLLVTAFYVWFYNGAWHNQNSRYDAIYTFVEPGPLQYTFRIDDWLPAPGSGLNTYDWSLVDGRYYANKAPGTLFMGVAVYWPLYHLERLVGIDPLHGDWTYINAWLINLFVTVLPALVALPFFYALVRRLTGGNERRAALTTVSLYLGTMMLTHATQFWGHVTVAAWVILALWAFTRRGWRSQVAAGFFAALCPLTEYPAAFIPVLMGGALVAQLRPWRPGWRRELKPWLRRVLFFGLGAFGPFVAYCVYHQLCFGSPLTTANAFANTDFVDQELAGGMFGLPKLLPLYGITFAPFRGLFWMSPVLLMAIPGFVLWWRRAPRRRGFRGLWGLSLATVVVFFLMNASFNGWHAGATVGPRYLIPMLPFMALALGFAPLGRGARLVYQVLLAVSVVGVIAVCSVSPIAMDTWESEPNPVHRRIAYMMEDNFIPNTIVPIRRDCLGDLDRNESMRIYGAFNLGTLHGLNGRLSLLPLGIIVALLGVALLRAMPTEALPMAALPLPVGRSAATEAAFAARLRPWLAVGLALVCIGFQSASSPRLASNFEVIPDSVEYAYGAKALWEHGRIRLPMAGQELPSRYPPGFSMLLAPAYGLTGDIGATIYPVLLLALCGALAGLAIGHRVAGWQGAALVTAALALHPHYTQLAQYVLTDVPAVACLLAGAALFLWQRAHAGFDLCACLAAGLIAALAVALRSTMLALLLPWAWLLLERRRTPLKRLALAALALGLPAAAVLLASKLYAHSLFGEWSRSGYHFWVAVPYDYLGLTFNLSYLPMNLAVLNQWRWIGALVVAIVAGVLLRSRAQVSTPSAATTSSSTAAAAGQTLAQYQGLALYLALAVVPLLALHLVYFFPSSRLFLPVTVSLCVLAACGIAALLRSRFPVDSAVGLLVILATLAVYYQATGQKAPPTRRIAAETVAAHTPPNSLIISAIEPLYFDLVLDDLGGRQFWPFSRSTEYASKLFSPTRIADPQPPLAGPYDHRAPGLLAGGALDIYPWTPAEDPDRLVAIAQMGAPIYLETSRILARDEDAVGGLTARFLLEPVADNLYRLQLLRSAATSIDLPPPTSNGD